MRTSSLIVDRSIATRQKLLAWYRRGRRDLPWRRTTDPYATWVSEIMLQQTRVAAVIPYYERFLKRFPDVASLARARIDSVLGLWSGLGYYRRARMLHQAAKTIAGEGLPNDAEGWRRLPGVGAYTAAAIASIAFGERVAVVDGNVERVICRFLARKDRRVRELAQHWMGRANPGDFNQAVMELGATVCTPRAPDCPRCPLQPHCLGRGEPQRYPASKRRAAVVHEEQSVGFVLRNGKVLLRRRQGDGVLEGMWELPPSRGRGEPLATVRHCILDRRIVMRVFEGAARTGDWFDRRRAGRIPLAAATRKCLEQVGFL